MKIFIDTADVEAIRRAKAMGFVSGVTTNPSLIAAEGKDFHTVIKEIASIVDGPVSAEVLSETAEEMIAEGQVLAGLDPHVVVKIPMTGEGMKAVSALSDMGIRSNVTLIFSAGQALLAARAGASYVSPFVGRIDDIGWDGVELIRTLPIYSVSTRSKRKSLLPLSASRSMWHNVPWRGQILPLFRTRCLWTLLSIRLPTSALPVLKRTGKKHISKTKRLS